MRPQILFPLFAPLVSLPGIGPKLAPAFARALGGEKIVDLIWHRPIGVVDRRASPMIAEAPDGAIATIEVIVDRHIKPPHPRQPTKIRCRDDSGFLHLVYFHAAGDWLEKSLPVGAKRIVSGRVERFRDEIQITHPDHVVLPEQREEIARIEPSYGLSAGITPRVMAKAMRHALKRAPELAEWLDPALVAREKWMPWREALASLHAPQSPEDLDPGRVSRRRLAYDELLANQLALILIRRHQRRLPGTALIGDGSLRAKMTAALHFTLTGAQQRSIAEIARDLASEQRMLRLLQGDVGSGKTVVALLAMLVAAEAGRQAALMAPTELLARQHHQTIAPLAESIGVDVALLTGREKGRARATILESLAEGRTKLVVGTHALFQDDVAFADLALAVIDEQHRFGVHQRLALTDKGERVHVLVMTATPIPRTLMLSVYGDMESSRLDEKPQGRKPVTTRVMPSERLDEIAEALRRRIDSGGKAFWVCPLVEESELVDLAAASERQVWLGERFGAERVALVHGQMKATDRDRAMARFIAGDAAILVATTVIEVGVDVPAATVMVVEHAERFGLAQLHQLRGRVGRGAESSTCLLVYQGPLGETAKARLAILRESDDGFRIAEEDLRLRGAGDVLGTKQSGMPSFKIADLAHDSDLLAIARDDARLIIERDESLRGPRGEALRALLYLFERDAAVSLIRSG
jgi:ATP-dependent DNA helicase RecG